MKNNGQVKLKTIQAQARIEINRRPQIDKAIITMKTQGEIEVRMTIHK